MSTQPRRVTENDLRKMRSEHDAYHALQAEAVRRERLMSVVGRVPLHLVPSDLRGCRGLSCEQYRKPCREGCDPTFKEMACTSGDAPDTSEGDAVWLGLGIAGVLVLVAFSLAYTFADRIVEVLRLVLN